MVTPDDDGTAETSALSECEPITADNNDPCSLNNHFGQKDGLDDVHSIIDHTWHGECHA